MACFVSETKVTCGTTFTASRSWIISDKTHVCRCRYWQTREQRAPTTTKMKPQGKAREEDQEQQDPMEFLQSDEEEEAAEEEKGNQAGGAAKRRLQEQRERLHGALALIELANNLSAWTRTRVVILDTPSPCPPLTSSPKPPSCRMCCR